MVLFNLRVNLSVQLRLKSFQVMIRNMSFFYEKSKEERKFKPSNIIESRVILIFLIYYEQFTLLLLASIIGCKFLENDLLI